ncbi:GntR family transcriptional regulator [Leifsonia sp. 2MCAF36]|uniref:GntR family transcriptional regulator n=1 Tax=Leifsonia sp. 2MCAF36 TaxID=3232988 RepID=UPI003F9C4A1D
MQIEIDPLSPVPLYQQLRDRVVEGIAGGTLRPGDQLAPVRQLAARFGINVATVSKGYDLLRAEGLVRSNRSAGSVVARGPRSATAEEAAWSSADRDAWAGRLATVLAEGVAQGEQDETIVAAAKEILSGFAAQRRNGGER